eukprot:366412-Chlamydomonas_euryale.AAC.22
MSLRAVLPTAFAASSPCRPSTLCSAGNHSTAWTRTRRMWTPSRTGTRTARRRWGRKKCEGSGQPLDGPNEATPCVYPVCMGGGEDGGREQGAGKLTGAACNRHSRWHASFANLEATDYCLAQMVFSTKPPEGFNMRPLRPHARTI